MAAAIAPRPRLAQPKLVGWIWDREFQNETHLLREDGLKILFEEWVRIILLSMFQPQFESVLYFWSIFGSSVNMFINLRSSRLDRLNRNKAKVVGPMEAMYKWRLQFFWFFLPPPSFAEFLGAILKWCPQNFQDFGPPPSPCPHSSACTLAPLLLRTSFSSQTPPHWKRACSPTAFAGWQSAADKWNKTQ